MPHKGWIKHYRWKLRWLACPDSAKAAARQQAQSRELEGWVFTLDIPSYLPVDDVCR